MTDARGTESAPSDTGRLSRRTFGLGVGAVAAANLAAGAAAASAAPARAAGTDSSPRLLPAPPPPRPLLSPRQVAHAVRSLDSLISSAMRRTGIPGLATAVVYRDRVIYARGFGLRAVGKSGLVGPDTVFQLASVSKPLASTIVAGLVGQRRIGWDDPVIEYNPRFALHDPYLTEHATFADLMSHRSGLKELAGDLLEDLGFSRDYILSHLYLEPLNPFRSTYLYSNFGYTAGGISAASAAGVSWEDLADRVLFNPLGMTRSSYRHSDFVRRANRAVIHVEVGNPKSKDWQPKYVRDADAEAPAGGASSSVMDLSKFVRLHLANGRYNGERMIARDALHKTWQPHQKTRPPQPADARTQFYGLGWNVSYDDEGRLKLDHSGAFFLGAATNVAMLPVEQLGIITLTNAQPIGVPEAVNQGFFDVAQHGRLTVDWLGFLEEVFRAILGADKPAHDYTKPPKVVTPRRPFRDYIGTYRNSYYGPLAVEIADHQLAMRLGPEHRKRTFPLKHYTGDTFVFRTIGENANGLAGAIFHAGGGRITSVTLDYYDRNGLGTFVR